tara:strand:- start:5113 stop:5637 length:525 start_codon:yes stop_codon:yes gene_type:complete
MARTTFSGPVRVGKAQKTSDAEFAGAVSLVATAYMADPTAATTTELRRGSSATGNSSKAVILPAGAIITKIEAEADATGGTNPTFDLGFIEVKSSGATSDTDGIIDNGDADAGHTVFDFSTATVGNDFGFVMSADFPVKITGGVGAAAATGGNINLRIHYHVYDSSFGTDGSAS